LDLTPSDRNHVPLKYHWYAETQNQPFLAPLLLLALQLHFDREWKYYHQQLHPQLHLHLANKHQHPLHNGSLKAIAIDSFPERLKMAKKFAKAELINYK
jgi:hypothetical protein